MAVCWRLTVLLAIFLFFCVAFLTVCWKHFPAVFDGLTDPSTAATPGTEARLVGGGLLCKKVGAGPVSMDTAGWKYLRSSSSSLGRGTRATSSRERTSATRGSTVLIGLAGRDVKSLGRGNNSPQFWGRVTRNITDAEQQRQDRVREDAEGKTILCTVTLCKD